RRVGKAHLVESTRISWTHEGLAARARTLAEAGIDAINLHAREWDVTGVAEVHATGLRAFGWDAQSEADISPPVRLGLDGIYSDYPARLMTAIKGCSA